MFPLQICTNHSYLTSNLTKAFRSSFNQTNVLKEGVLAACAVNTAGAPQTQHPWAALHKAEPLAEEPLLEDVGNKDMILLQLQREPRYQDWIPGLKPASHHYNVKDECWFFQPNSNTRQPEAESSSPALAFLKCRRYKLLFYRTDQSALSKAPFCSVSVWLSSVAQEDQHRPTYTNIIFSKKYTHSNALGEMPQVLKTSS